MTSRVLGVDAPRDGQLDGMVNLAFTKRPQRRDLQVDEPLPIGNALRPKEIAVIQKTSYRKTLIVLGAAALLRGMIFFMVPLLGIGTSQAQKTGRLPWLPVVTKALNKSATETIDQKSYSTSQTTNITVKNNKTQIIATEPTESLSSLTAPSLAPLSVPPLSPPKRIHLLGERNSGTNYIESFFKKAFFPDYVKDPILNKVQLGRNPSRGRKYKYMFPYAEGSPVFEFKHMFRHALLNDTEIKTLKENDDILWILGVRSPCDWADGMFRKPHQLCPLENLPKCKRPAMTFPNLHGMTRAKFFEMPWNDYMEAQETPNNFTYPNVFALRRHKLLLMQQLIEAVPHRAFIAHLKLVEGSPARFIDSLVTRFHLNYTGNATQFLPSDRQHKTLCLNREEFEIARREIDWDLEGFFGFSPLECHLCE